ncbi:MAG: transglutaminase domain-containing protein [Armatimonadetes bacterium]|nr:transglutaminase domain-containing protein [Armatimonadota bacterium]
MSSLARASSRFVPDEVILFLSGGLAISMALLVAGWSAGSPRVGLVGAAFAAVGVWASWRLQHFESRRHFVIGGIGGLVAAGSYYALIGWEISTETGMLYRAMADVGLQLALRMGVLLIAFCFLLVSRNVLAFALVPALVLFGLAGARGQTTIAFVSFTVFLSAALIAVSQAMMLSGASVKSREDRLLGCLSHWRARHWLLIGGLIATIVALGTMLYLPAYAYGTQYYWQLAMMNLNPPTLGRIGRGSPSVDLSKSYSVGTGPVAPTRQALLSFDSEPPYLWRGEAFDIYTGNAWRSSHERLRPLPVNDGVIQVSRWDVPRTNATDYTVRVESDLPLILFAPGRLHEAELPPAVLPSLRQGIYVDKFGCVFAPGTTLSAGARYRITVDPNSFELRSAEAEEYLTPLSELDQSYLGIPLSSRRVADLARRVAGSATTPMEKLAALSQHLRQNYTYTLAAPSAPPGEDATEHFLFQSRRGYCDLFASALAIMGRAVGVPTRFVTGFVGPQYDPETKRYVFREEDAHAWVEAYVPPHGWIAVDATPGGGPSPVPPFQRTVLAVRFALQDHPVLIGVLVATLLVTMLVSTLLMRRARHLRGRRFGDKHEPRAIVVRTYDQLTRILSGRGRPRRPTQTALEYLRALESDADWVSRRPAPLPAASLVPIRSLTEIFLRARYSAAAVGEEDAKLALEQLRETRSTLRGRSAPA